MSVGVFAATVEVLQLIRRVGICARRRTDFSGVSMNGLVTCQQGVETVTEKAPSESESTANSTEPGDHSYNDFSDQSDPSSGSNDDSDTEIAGTIYRQAGPPLVLPPSWRIRPPPGLDAPPGLNLASGSGGLAQTAPASWPCVTNGTRLNAQAAVFHPRLNAVSLCDTTSSHACNANCHLLGSGFQSTHNSQQTSRSSRLLGGATDVWKAAFQETSLNSWQETMRRPELHALQEALAKLPCEDAQVVRSVLDVEHVGQAACNSTYAPPGSASMNVISQCMYQNEPLQSQCLGTSNLGLIGGVPHIRYSSFQPDAPPSSMPSGIFCYGQGAPSRFDGHYVWNAAGCRQQQVFLASNSQQQILAPAQKVKEADQEHPKVTLSTNLRDLTKLDPTRVVSVRKINRLGLESAAILKAHFSKFGEVDRIMVNHSRAKSIFGRGEARVRPAGLGFVVMEKPEDVEAVLRAGTGHFIEGATIWCSRFEPRKSFEQTSMEADIDFDA